MIRSCLTRASTTTRRASGSIRQAEGEAPGGMPRTAGLSPHELVDHARDVTARQRADSHFPGAVDGLSEAAVYAGVTEEACNDGGAAVAGAARPADIDAEEVPLHRPDRQAIGPRRSKLRSHSRGLSATKAAGLTTLLKSRGSYDRSG